MKTQNHFETDFILKPANYFANILQNMLIKSWGIPNARHICIYEV